ncbi:hypothetical protein D3C72_1368870 [compost metagenome]
MLLPRNSNLAMHQEAATPNTRFSGTAMAAVIRVNLIAEIASGSMMAAIYASQPFLNASANTATRGTMRKAVRNSRAMVINTVRTHNGSSTTGPTFGSKRRAVGSALSTPAAAVVFVLMISSPFRAPMLAAG